MKEIGNILREIRTNPEAIAMLAERERPESVEKEAEVYAEVAGKLGYEITAEDIRKYLSDADAGLRGRTEEAAEGIRELSDEDMGRVAGGGDHPECQDTFQDRENCWIHDGCDQVRISYDRYICKRSFKEMTYCQYKDEIPNP